MKKIKINYTLKLTYKLSKGTTPFVAMEPHLKHGVGEEGLQSPLLTVRFSLVLLEQFVKVSVLFAVGQDLQAVLMVPHKLLIDVEHGQQDVKQVSWKRNSNLGCVVGYSK